MSKLELRDFFPMFDKLEADERELILQAAFVRQVRAGDIIHDGSGDCLGLVLVRDGQLRAFIRSEDGREITVYRLFSRDICLMAASCMMRSIMFDITIGAEKDSEIIVIPADVWSGLVSRSALLANFTNEIMGTRFTDVMWLVEQIMWKSFDRRLATFLIEEAAIEGTDKLSITHERIASHLGTAREVVGRMLKYFSLEGYVKLTRGGIEIIDKDSLFMLSE